MVKYLDTSNEWLPKWVVPSCFGSFETAIVNLHLVSTFPFNHDQLPGVIMESTETDGFHLLQRPESSGADVSDFSFAKPASNRKPFSLRNIPKQPSITQNTLEDTHSAKDSAERQVATNEPSIRPNTYVLPPFHRRMNDMAYNGSSLIVA